MRHDAVLPLVATLVSLEFTLALLRRWYATRRAYLRSWTLSLGCFTAGCAALWYGTAFGWSGPSFRTYYICGAVLSVLWLAMGELELLLRPHVARILLVFLVLLSANVVISLAAVPFVDGKEIARLGLPHGHDYYPVGARVLVVLANVLGTFVVVGGTIWSGLRSRRGGAAARARFHGTLLIVAGVLVSAAGGAVTFLAEAEAVAACLAVGAGLMYLGFVAASRRPGAHRAAGRRRREEVAAVTVAAGERA